MKIFITGATGFIGSKLLEKLGNENHDIICLTRNLKKNRKIVDNNIKFIEGNLNKPESYEKYLKNVDIVYYLAGIVKHDLFSKKELFEINVDGTKIFFEILKKNKPKKIIYVSSAAIFHPTKSKIVNEKTLLPTKFINYYSYTKYISFLEVKKFEKEGLPVIYILPVSIYGENSPLFNDFVLYLSRKLYITPPFEIKMSLVEVEDVVNGIILASSKGVIGESYILSGETKTIKDIVKIVNAHLNYKPLAIKIPAYLLNFFIFLLDLFSFIFLKKFYINKEIFNFIYGGLVASSNKAQKELNWKYKDFNQSFNKMIVEMFKKQKNGNR